MLIGARIHELEAFAGTGFCFKTGSRNWRQPYNSATSTCHKWHNQTWKFLRYFFNFWPRQWITLLVKSTFPSIFIITISVTSKFSLLFPWLLNLSLLFPWLQFITTLSMTSKYITPISLTSKFINHLPLLLNLLHPFPWPLNLLHPFLWLLYLSRLLLRLQNLPHPFTWLVNLSLLRIRF